MNPLHHGTLSNPPLLLAATAIGGLLLLILRYKLHPFLSLLLVSILLALAAGLPISTLAQTIEDGAGKTLGHITLIVALGAMLGKMIDASGGAEAFGRVLVSRAGKTRAPLALGLAGFVLGIPIFFEVGVVILMPVAQGIARSSAKALVAYALPMCIALLVVHALLPPHPGVVASASILGADIGRILLWGLPVAAVTAAVACRVALAIANGRALDTSPAAGSTDAEPPTAPSLAPAIEPQRRVPRIGELLLIILGPIVLIMAGTLSTSLFPNGSTMGNALTLLGTPFVALLLDVLLCLHLLRNRCGWTGPQLADILAGSLHAIAPVVLITGAGGVFARVLIDTHMGDSISTLLESSGLPPLAMAFLLTLLLRVSQGPTTVALITTAGILTPLFKNRGFDADHLALLCVAMGAGGMAGSHVNDPGFWFVTRLAGLSVSQGLKSWTLVTTCAGITAFALTAVLWSLI